MDHPKHYSQGKDVYQYTCPWPMYALDWSKSRQEQESFRLAVGSFIEDNNNKVNITTIFIAIIQTLCVLFHRSKS
jgi:WD repeat-containing protein 68